MDRNALIALEDLSLVVIIDHVAGVAVFFWLTIATKRVNGFFREIEFSENRIFDPPPTTYVNYSTFNVSHVSHGTKNGSKD